MAVCPRCGNSKWFLVTAQCGVCARAGCERCLSTFGTFIPAPGQSASPEAARTCSRECFDRWASSHISEGHAPLVYGGTATIGGVHLTPAFAPIVAQLHATHVRTLQLAHAKNLIEAERFEDAAKIYESFGMWSEAGDARRAARRHVTTHVQLNLNDLLDQVRRGGLTTTYSCPACNSPIQISRDVSENALRACSYCGATIQTTDLVDFLTRVVGYR